MVLRNGLGRGLGALIPPEVSTGRHSALREIQLSSIRPNQFQPRKSFDEEALSSLVDSIRTVGILQPVLVRAVGEDEFELIAGERRCRAARRAGLQTVPALVQMADDVASLEQALVENLHREDLNALDEAAAYQQLIEDFNLTHDEVAQRVGRSRTAVTNALRLFQLPPAVQRIVRDGRLSAGHARAILMTPDRDMQLTLANEAVETGLSVRALEERARSRVAIETGDDASPGDDAVEATMTSSRRPLRSPGILELEELLASHLDTRVRVESGTRRGRVIIEFADLPDLERVYRLIIADAPK